jgi:hypothetical protein
MTVAEGRPVNDEKKKLFRAFYKIRRGKTKMELVNLVLHHERRKLTSI